MLKDIVARLKTYSALFSSIKVIHDLLLSLPICCSVFKTITISLCFSISYLSVSASLPSECPDLCTLTNNVCGCCFFVSALFWTVYLLLQLLTLVDNFTAAWRWLYLDWSQLCSLQCTLVIHRYMGHSCLPKTCQSSYIHSCARCNALYNIARGRRYGCEMSVH